MFRITEALCRQNAKSNPYINPFGTFYLVYWLYIHYYYYYTLIIFNPSAFYCSKGHYSFAAPWFIDANYSFIAISANSTGFTHDYTASAMSNFECFLTVPASWNVTGLQETMHTVSEGALWHHFEKKLTHSLLKKYNFYLSSHLWDSMYMRNSQNLCKKSLSYVLETKVLKESILLQLRR